MIPRAECPLDGHKDKFPRQVSLPPSGAGLLWPSAAYARIAKMKISLEDVVRVAELAYLELSETELETYRAQIDEILEYIGKLNQLDTANVEPMAQVLTLDQTADATLREDTVAPCGIAAEILPQAPDPDPPFFRVPKVIER